MRVLFPRAQIVAVEAPLPAIKCLPTDAEATAGPRRISAIEVIEQHPLQPPLRCPAATLPEARQLARLGKFTPSDFAHPDTLQSVTNHSERAQPVELAPFTRTLPRRSAFGHFPDDFSGAKCVGSAHINSLLASEVFHAQRDFVFAKGIP